IALILFVLIGGCSSDSSDVSGIKAASNSGSGWASSGGELLNDSQNPWWVKNTRAVQYCIDVDTVGFSASLDKAREAVEGALKYWKDQFATRIPFLPQAKENNALQVIFDFMGIGTQEFSEVPCSGTEDLRFQFGYGTLSAEQLGHIADPRSYVGVTERTS